MPTGSIDSDAEFLGSIARVRELARGLVSLGYNEAWAELRPDEARAAGEGSHSFRRHGQRALAEINRHLREMESRLGEAEKSPDR